MGLRGPAKGSHRDMDKIRAAEHAAIQWVRKFWPGVLKQLMKSEDERILLDLGKLMLSYAYGRPREMVEHTGDVVHTYVIEAPAKAGSADEWAKKFSPPGMVGAVLPGPATGSVQTNS